MSWRFDFDTILGQAIENGVSGQDLLDYAIGLLSPGYYGLDGDGENSDEGSVPDDTPRGSSEGPTIELPTITIDVPFGDDDEGDTTDVSDTGYCFSAIQCRVNRLNDLVSADFPDLASPLVWHYPLMLKNWCLHVGVCVALF